VEDDERTMSLEERNFAAEVKRLREEADMSQAELLQKMHDHGLTYLNQTALSRIENARRQVRMIESLALMRIFNRPLTAMTKPDPRQELLQEATFVINLVEHAKEALQKAGEELGARQAAAWEVIGRMHTAFEDFQTMDPDVMRQLAGHMELLMAAVAWPPPEVMQEITGENGNLGVLVDGLREARRSRGEHPTEA
jgi:transcriptional regulator with XRE-family HTH domain